MADITEESLAKALNLLLREKISLEGQSVDYAAQQTAFARDLAMETREVLNIRQKVSDEDREQYNLVKRNLDSAKQNLTYLRESNQLSRERNKDRQNGLGFDREINSLLSRSLDLDKLKALKAKDRADALAKYKKATDDLLKLDQNIARLEAKKGPLTEQQTKKYLKQLEIRQKAAKLAQQEADNELERYNISSQLVSNDEKRLTLLLASRKLNQDLMQEKEKEIKLGHEINKNMGIVGGILEGIDKVGVRIFGGLGVNLGVFKEAIGDASERMKEVSTSYAALDRAAADVNTLQKKQNELRQIGQDLSEVEKIKLQDLAAQQQEYAKGLIQVSGYRKQYNKLTDQSITLGEDISKAQEIVNDLQEKQKKLKEEGNDLSDEENKTLKETIELLEEKQELVKGVLKDQQEILTTVAKENVNRSLTVKTFNAIKASLGDIKKGLMTTLKDALTPAILVTNLLKGAFNLAVTIIKESDKALSDLARSTGLARSEAYELRSQFNGLGDGIWATSAEMAKMTGLIVSSVGGSLVGSTKLGQSFKENVAFMTELSTRAGLADESVLSIYKSSTLTGQSVEKTVSSAGKMAAQFKLQKGASIDVRTVLNDIGKASAKTRIMLSQYPEGLVKAGFEARRLGMELSSLGGVQSNLLDIEKSISNEFESQLLTGIAVDASKLRSLAHFGTELEIAEELNRILDEHNITAEKFVGFGELGRQAFSQNLGYQQEQLAVAIETRAILKDFGGEEEYKAEYERLAKLHDHAYAIGELGDNHLTKMYQQNSAAEVMGRIQAKVADLMERVILPVSEAVLNLLLGWFNSTDKVNKVITDVADNSVEIKQQISEAGMGIKDFAIGFMSALGFAKDLAGVVSSILPPVIRDNLGKILGIAGVVVIAAKMVGKALLGVTPMTAMWVKIAGGMPGVPGNVASKVGTAAATAGTTAATTAATAGTTAARTAATASTTAAAQGGGILSKMGGAIKGVGSVLKNPAAALRNAGQLVKGGAQAMNPANLFKEALKRTGGISGFLKTAMKGGGIGAVIEALFTLPEIYSLLGNPVSEDGTALSRDDLSERIGLLAGGSVSRIIGTGLGAAAGTFLGLGPLIGGWLGSVGGDALYKIIADTFPDLNKGIGGLLVPENYTPGTAIAEDQIPEYAKGGIVPATPGGRIVKVAEAGQAEAIIPLPSEWKKGGGAGGSDAIFKSINSNITNLTNVTSTGLGDVTKTYVDQARSFKDSIIGSIGSIKESISGKISSIKDSITGKINSIKEGITGKIASIKEGITGKIASFKEGITGRIASLKERGQGLLDGAKGKLLGLGGGQEGIGGKLKGLFGRKAGGGDLASSLLGGGTGGATGGVLGGLMGGGKGQLLGSLLGGAGGGGLGGVGGGLLGGVGGGLLGGLFGRKKKTGMAGQVGGSLAKKAGGQLLKKAGGKIAGKVAGKAAGSLLAGAGLGAATGGLGLVGPMAAKLLFKGGKKLVQGIRKRREARKASGQPPADRSRMLKGMAGLAAGGPIGALAASGNLKGVGRGLKKVAKFTPLGAGIGLGKRLLRKRRGKGILPEVPSGLPTEGSTQEIPSSGLTEGIQAQEEMTGQSTKKSTSTSTSGGGGQEAVIGKLDELLSAVKQGGHVYIDGNKVGQAIVMGSSTLS